MASTFSITYRWLQNIYLKEGDCRASGGSGGEMFTLSFSLEAKDKGGVFCLPILTVHPCGSTGILQKLPPF